MKPERIFLLVSAITVITLPAHEGETLTLLCVNNLTDISDKRTK